MMKTQEQPFNDLRAVERAPALERVVEQTRKVQPAKSPFFWPMIFSYLISVGVGALIVYLINLVFGSPYNQGLIQFESSMWRVGIPLSIVSSFLLGIVLPIIFTKRRRSRVILLTLVMQFVTLSILVIVGLYQLGSIA